MAANFAKLLELLRKLGTMPVHLIRRRKWPQLPGRGLRWAFGRERGHHPDGLFLQLSVVVDDDFDNDFG